MEREKNQDFRQRNEEKKKRTKNGIRIRYLIHRAT